MNCFKTTNKHMLKRAYSTVKGHKAEHWAWKHIF